jgi:phosphopantetheine--protein transferase-like protein
MPFIQFETSLPDVTVGRWIISEKEPDFYDSATDSYYAEDLARIQSPQQRLQFLAARHTAHTLLKEYPEAYIARQENGYPRLVGAPGFVSLSHTTSHAVAIYSDNRLVGIDIEDTSRIRSQSMARMFMVDTALEHFERTHDMRFFYLKWAAKESLYKAVSDVDRALSFKRHIKVIAPLEAVPNEGILHGEVHQDDLHKHFSIHFRFIQQLLITCAVEL